MNQRIKSVLGIAAVLAFAAESHAATIWQPTDVLATGNVNIIQFPVPGLTLNGGTLALFADTDTTFSNPLVLGSNGGSFDFTDIGGGAFQVSALVNNVPQGPALTMTGSEFLLGVKWGAGTFFGDSSYTASSGDPTTFLISFTDGVNVGNTLAVDLTPIPLPAAAWLFGSGLLGLAAAARRRKARA